MILYVDSSSIVKLYVDEDGSQEKRRAKTSADFVASSTLAYAEVRAALAVARRGRKIRTEPQFDRSKRDFEADWPSFFRLDVRETEILHSGDLAEQHALSGFDAIHLATMLRSSGALSR